MRAGLVVILAPMGKREREKEAKKKLMAMVQADLAELQKTLILLSSAVSAFEEDNSALYAKGPFFMAAMRASRRIKNQGWGIYNRFNTWSKQIRSLADLELQKETPQ